MHTSDSRPRYILATLIVGRAAEQPQNLEEEYYDSSMPDSDNYPSPPSGSGGHLHSKDISPDRRPVIMSINNPDRVPQLGRKYCTAEIVTERDQEPPRNEGGQITCIHQECSRDKPPTFQRKCEWRLVFYFFSVYSLAGRLTNRITANTWTSTTDHTSAPSPGAKRSAVSPTRAVS
jgi:hypothetical protein